MEYVKSHLNSFFITEDSLGIGALYSDNPEYDRKPIIVLKIIEANGKLFFEVVYKDDYSDVAYYTAEVPFQL